MGPVIRRFVAFAILFVVLGVLEGLFAARRDQRRFRKGWKTDVLHFAFTEALTQVGLVLAILPLALLVHFLAPVGPRLWVQALPGGVQVLLAVVLIDFLGYWRHRLAHGDEIVPRGLHLFSRFAYLWWVVAYVTGAALVALERSR